MAKCKHNAGWWTDRVLLWGDSEGVYLEDSIDPRQRRRRGKLRLKCNMQGCQATRNAYFTVPLPVKLGRVKR